jgi:molecular chaperone Hsp33
MVRAIAADGAVRGFAIGSTALAEEARRRHNTWPVVTAALGRFLSAAAMMGTMMKGEEDLLTLTIRSGGPMKGMTMTADSHGNVKGYPVVAEVDLPPSSLGKLDVGRAVGPGELTVIRDQGLKEPYSSTTLLQTGEIGDDLTYYFAASEQTPSAVGLGVLMNTNNTVRKAGGFIVQLMPFAGEPVIAQLEKNVAAIGSVTALLDRGYTPEALLERVLDGMDVSFTDRMPVRFSCSCSKDRIRRVLTSIGTQELDEMIREGKTIEVKCHFCNTAYPVTVEELIALRGK